MRGPRSHYGLPPSGQSYTPTLLNIEYPTRNIESRSAVHPLDNGYSIFAVPNKQMARQRRARYFSYRARCLFSKVTG